MDPLKLDSNCPVFEQNPVGHGRLTQQMINAALKCGSYQDRGCNYEVIPPNRVHPGEGPGDLDFKPYIVQFDIGVHANLKNKVEGDHQRWGKGQPCIGCKPEGGETCLELIVKGNSAATGTGCAGKCGIGCIQGSGWAKDCMKHDVVSILFHFL